MAENRPIPRENAPRPELEAGEAVGARLSRALFAPVPIAPIVYCRILFRPILL